MTPESVLEQWAQCFNNGDLDGITRLYHLDSTLLPTLASNMNLSLAIGYFLLLKFPLTLHTLFYETFNFIAEYTLFSDLFQFLPLKTTKQYLPPNHIF